MMREIIVLLAIAGAACALEPAVVLKEYPHAELHADGTQEYYFNYELLVSNPSAKDGLWFFIANYSLPAGFSIMETDADFAEKKRLSNSGAIQKGLIKPRANFSYYYRITPQKLPFELNSSIIGNELLVRIYNSGSKQLRLKYLEPEGWNAVSSNAGRMEAGRIVLEGEEIGPKEERVIKVVSSSVPAGYGMAFESPESFLESLKIEKIASESLLSVEKQTGEGGAYAITLTYLNPTEFAQEVTELKLLKTNAPFVNLGNASTVWRLENKTLVEPGKSLEFTITDRSDETPFYWYSAKANTGYNFSAEKRELVIEVKARAPAAPTGFAVFGLSDKNFLGSILEYVVDLLKNIF